MRPMVLGNIKTGDGKRAERERQTTDGLPWVVTPSEPGLSSPLAPPGLAKPPLHAEPRALGPTPQVPLHTPQSKSASLSHPTSFTPARSLGSPGRGRHGAPRAARPGDQTPHHGNVSRRRTAVPEVPPLPAFGSDEEAGTFARRAGGEAGQDSGADSSALPAGGEGGAHEASSTSLPSTPGVGLWPRRVQLEILYPEATPAPRTLAPELGPPPDVAPISGPPRL